jgi:tetratricopeptide (TPR) repeat protein
LGQLLSYRGIWKEAEQELKEAWLVFNKHGQNNLVSVTRAYQAFHALFMARSSPEFRDESLKLANRFSQSALEISRALAIKYFPTERDFVRAYWLLGATHRAKNEFIVAEKHLGEALRRCRAINAVAHEADILIEIAKLCYVQGETDETLQLTQEALVITERCGYVLQGADVHLFLAELALAGLKITGEEEMSDQEAAKLHAQKALELANCDGPPYYYKVAYEEAERLLEKLK